LYTIAADIHSAFCRYFAWEEAEKKIYYLFDSDKSTGFKFMG